MNPSGKATTKKLKEGRVYLEDTCKGYDSIISIRSTLSLYDFDSTQFRDRSISGKVWLRTISIPKRPTKRLFRYSISSSKEIGKKYRCNIIFTVEILFRNLLSKSIRFDHCSPNKLSSFKLHESNYIYAKFRIKLQQVLIYIEPVYMARVIYWTCFAIKRDCLITDATNSESTRPLIPSSRGQIPRNQPFTYVYTSSPFFYHPLKSTIRFLKISYLFPFRFHLWNGK